MDSNTKNFAVKCLAVVSALFVLRVGWIALDVFGVYIAIFAVVTLMVASLALIIAPNPTTERLRAVVASVRSIFS